MSDPSLWLPLGTAAIAATAALSGSALGPTLGARREHDQWLRNKRAELLESFCAVLAEADVKERSPEMFYRLDDASARASVYCSRSLNRRLKEVCSAYRAFVLPPVVPLPPSRDDPEAAAFSRWRSAVEACTKAIRKELGVR